MKQCQIKLFYNFLTARLVTSIEKHQQGWALDLGLQINSAKSKMVYRNNYSCTLETKLRSFQLELNHKVM